MKKETTQLIETFFVSNPELSSLSETMISAVELLNTTFTNKGMVLICGNGGSASDSEHIVGELMKGFLHKRPIGSQDSEILKKNLDRESAERIRGKLQGALPAISLVSQHALITAFANDVDPDMIFAQQVYGYKGPHNILIGLTTSGNSKNVVNAILTAKGFGMPTIGFTGRENSIVSEQATLTFKVPSQITYEVQEYHIKLYHLLCMCIESEQFSREG